MLRDAEGESVLVAVAADGAGSASMGLTGATVMCQQVIAGMAALLAAGLGVEDLRRSHVAAILDAFQLEIAALATAQSLRPRDFACTLVTAVLGREAAVFAQIGDGGIVVGHTPHEYLWVFWPDEGAPEEQASFRGEYANQTRFATDADAQALLAFDYGGRRVEEIALFSDGLQRLTLDLAGIGAHEPFFAPLFETMRSQLTFDPVEASASLERFLNSPRVNERTDDDKTLILATRRPMQHVTVNSVSRQAPGT
jgi:hypothetical protein